MGDMLRKGSQWLNEQRHEHMTSPVEYHRAGLSSATLQATFGKTDYQLHDEFGAEIGASMIDFLIRVDDLTIEPEPGDWIIADGRTYEVMNLSGQSCWRWSDPYRQTLRIHTKDIGAAS